MDFLMALHLPLDLPGTVEFDDDGIPTTRTLLPSGIRVLTQHIPGQKSVSLGFWVGAGSRDESAGAEGSTHFLEHLLFKGTHTRTAAEISALGDALGGTMNAATARLYTCYYGRVFAGDVPDLLTLLVDMFCNSKLDRADMELERGVILEELAAADDDVADVAADAILELVMGKHPLARPIGGTFDTVKALDHDHLLDHYRSNYHAGELVVTAAGDVDHDQLLDLLLTELRSVGWNLEDRRPVARRREADVQYAGGGEGAAIRAGRQSAVVVGYPGLPLLDEREEVIVALDTILGGGQSSRLFREVRERRGLAYATYSWQTAYLEGGVAGMTALCAPQNASTVADIMTGALHDIADNGVTDVEIETAFRQRRVRLVFSSESNSFRRSRLGNSELITGRLRSLDEVLEQARAVTGEQVQSLAQDIASSPRSLMIVGPQV
ncbi:insulinase family protein [Trueperella pecoris]|uniref:Insulinase family protein n=2 Tax=Trueperella pecoris TaxID=2733571 RepID=A0A7M1QYR2_9ACTO|nr:insulinase family protein [Trueperella pecoris]QOR46327.1 insulinase family protein [Trueperella pecoris]QTG76153.1 insulinase family protein [Trueperella pecoris]